MSEKKPSSSARLVVAALVVAGAAGAYFYFKGTFGKVSSPLDSAKVVPDEAVMAAYIFTDTPAWSKLQEFGTPQAQGAIAQSIQNLQTQMLKQTRVNYDKDLKPWISGVTIALMPTPAPPPTTAQTAPAQQPKPNVLIVVGIKNKLKAWYFARQLQSQKGVKQQESKYKGVTISELIPQSGDASYSAVLNNHLVISSNRTNVEQAIDTFLGEPSFASNPEASKIIGEGAIVENPIAEIYIPEYAKGMQQLAETVPQQSLSPQANYIKSVVVGAGVDDAGVRVRSLATVDPQMFPQSNQPAQGKVVGRFPASTMAFVSGQGISQGWSNLVAQSKDYPAIENFVNGVRESLKSWANLDADKEVFGWMDGEFAVGVISSNQGMLAPLGFGGAMILETSDRQNADAALKKLDAIAKTLVPLPVSINERNVQSTPVTELTIPGQGALVGHGWQDRNSVFLAIGGPLVDVMATPPSNPLNTSPTFQAIAGSLPTPNQGYFYMDMDKIMSVVNTMSQQYGSPIPPDVNAVLSSMQGIAVTGTWADPSTSRAEMLLALKRNK